MEIITGKIEKPQKVFLYGVEGIGKSTFAAKFPNPLFIDTEGSTNHMDVRRTQTPTSWAMLVEHVREVKANPSLCKTLVIDTIDWAERLCVQNICATGSYKSIEDPGYGKGYTFLAEEFGRFLNLLTDLTNVGINVVLTAHAQIKQTEIPEETGKYEFWTLKLEKKTSPMLKEWADLVLFANYKTRVVQNDKTKQTKAVGGQRFMYTTHRTTHDAKNRHNLPEELEFDYRHIAHIFDNAEATLAVPAQQTSDVPASPVSTSGPTGEVESKPGVVEAAQKDEAEATLAVPAKPSDVDSANTQVKENTFTVPDWAKWRDDPQPWTPPPIPPDKDYLKPLYDLMEANKVSDMMLREVVADKGLGTLQQTIENYHKDLVTSVLIAQWPSVFKTIKKTAEEAMPF